MIYDSVTQIKYTEYGLEEEKKNRSRWGILRLYEKTILSFEGWLYY